MGIERFGGQGVSSKEHLRVGGEVFHVPGESAVEEIDASFSEEIIKGSDRGSQEELVSALHLMMNKNNVPVSALEELKGDEEKIDTVNMLANEYLVAVKELNIKRQGELAKSLVKLLG